VKDMTGVTIDLRTIEDSGFRIRASGKKGNNAGRKRQAVKRRDQGRGGRDK
jgi:hypothetical protein